MSSAPRVYSSAFILLHGAVIPEFVREFRNYPRGPPCYEYQLSPTELPENITLYAPSILGYSYYDQTNTDEFITRMNGKYKRDKKSDGPSYSDFFLNEIRKLEQRHVTRLKNKLEDESEALDSSKALLDRKKRLYKLEVTTLKPRVVWKQHDCYIREKSYDIYPTSVTDTDTDNELPNCIMIFCENVIPDVEGVIERTFNDPKTTYVLFNGKSIVYTVHYDSYNSIFRINFDNTKYVEDIPFEDIKDIILFILLHVTPATGLNDINLSLFDFTCSEIEFPVHQLPIQLTSVLLSSDNTQANDPKLVYGTISENRFSQIESEVRHLQAAFNASKSPSPSSTSVSPPPSEHPYNPYTPSPARPTASLVVHLLGEVESFADFQPSIISSSHSVEPRSNTSSLAFGSFSSSASGSSASGSSDYGPSPFFTLKPSSVSSSVSSSASDYGSPAFMLSPSSASIDRSGGSHRRHRGVNKVSRKRRHNLIRHTTVRSKLSNRRRGTKSKR